MTARSRQRAAGSRASLPRSLRLPGVLAAAVCFGVLVAIVKGQGAGARDAFGNLSAPWLLLAFLAGASAARTRWALLAGLAATLTALAGFYTAESVILDLGPHPWPTDLQLAVRAGHVYFATALLSGPLFGVLGRLWARRRSPLPALPVAAAFVGEPLAVWLVQQRRGPSGGSGLLTQYPSLWASEILIGLALVMLAARQTRRAERPR